MATMPASGSIGIISAPQTNGSICTVVGQTIGSLLALGADARKAKPVCMRNFYSYVGPAASVGVGFCQISTAGACGTSTICNTICICVPSSTPMVAGQCYNITLNHCLTSNTQSGSRSCIILCCNGSALYNCSVSLGGTTNFSCTFTMCDTQTICFMQCSIHPVPGGTGLSCTNTTVTNVTNASPAHGLFANTGAGCLIFTC
jgi:hypothetical protein